MINRHPRIQRSTVLILAAGKGTRMGRLGRLLNKVLFPIGHKAAISKIIELFPFDSKFIVATNYLEEQIQFYMKQMHPHVEVEFVHVDRIEGTGTGPGYSCLKAIDLVTGPFYLVCGDSLWESDITASSTTNWVGLSKVSFDEFSRFCMLRINQDNRVTDCLDKVESGHKTTDLGFNGLAYIQDVDLFRKGLQSGQEIAGEVQISNGFKALISQNLLEGRLIPDWLDIGTLKSYEEYLRHHSIDLLPKNSGATYIGSEQVIKLCGSSDEAQKLAHRALQNPSIFPNRIGVQGEFLTYQYVHGQTFYEKATTDLFLQFLDWCKVNLWKNYEKVTTSKFGTYLERQLAIRKEIFLSLNPVALEDCCINGTEVSPMQILDSLRLNEIASCVESFFHGDLQFSNIIVCSNQFKLIDWRSDIADSMEKADLVYDFAKLNLGLEILLLPSETKLARLKKNGRQVEIDELKSIDHKHAYQSILRHFVTEIGVDFKKVEILTGFLMLTMAGVHDKNFSHWIWYRGLLYLHFLDE